jgi:hypothetical protein
MRFHATGNAPCHSCLGTIWPNDRLSIFLRWHWWDDIQLQGDRIGLNLRKLTAREWTLHSTIEVMPGEEPSALRSGDQRVDAQSADF